MRAKAYYIDIKEGWNSGGEGMCLRGVEGANGEGSMDTAQEGSLIAHDILEHHQGFDKIGGIIDELKAIGSAVYIRGRRTVTVEGIGYDVVNLCRYTNFEFTDKVTRPCEDDQFLQDAMSYARKAHDSEDSDGQNQSLLRVAIHYMREGYRKAQRRFGCRDTANYLFTVIEKAVDSWYKLRNEWEREAKLIVNYEHLTARIESGEDLW
jgi:hypothetical protein